MGQNSSDIIESKSIYIHNWLPLEHQPSVFINKVTLEQVQRHSLHISTHSPSAQMSVYAGRINNHQPYICRLLYFHPVLSEHYTIKQEVAERQYHFYTDKLFPIRQWNYDNVIMILHGFRKLVSLYGPIQITEKMIAQSSADEIKVWISDDAISNQPNRRYVFEEDTAKDLIKIFKKKNFLIAKLFENSASISQIIQKLNKERRQSSFNHQNGKHNFGLKHFQSQDSFKPNNRIFSATSYKNPFAETSDSLRNKQQNSPINVPGVKSFQKFTFTPYNKRTEGQAKPTSKGSNFADFNKYSRQKVNKTQLQANNQSISKSKSTNQMFLQFKKNRQSDNQPRSNYSSLKNQIIQENKPIEPPTMAPSHLSLQKPNIANLSTSPKKPYQFKPRMQTKFVYNPPFVIITDKHKPIVGEGIKKEQGDKLRQKSFKEGSPEKQAHRLPAKNINRNKLNQQQKNYIGQNITIINNNVNNYINNITHNHIVKIQKTPQLIQFKSPTNHVNMAQNKTASNNSSQIGKGYKEKLYVPGFIAHKKAELNPFVQEHQGNLSSKPKSFSKSPPGYFQFQNFSITEANWNKSFQKSQAYDKSNIFQKSDNRKIHFVPKNNHSSSYKGKMEIPLEQNASQMNIKYQNVPLNSFHRNFNGNQNEFHVPLRTKTTQFYQKHKDYHKKGQFGKSFTRNEAQNKPQPKMNIFQKIQTEQQPPILVNNKSYKKQQLKADMKNILIDGQTGFESKKKLNSQLKNQFKSLLFDSNNLTPPQNLTAIKKTQSTHEAVKQTRQVKQVEVKDKIKKKQTIFAQLKKQANTLLN